MVVRSTHDESVQFHQIGDQQWRVLRPGFPNDDVRSVLGFVEHAGTRFEVTRLGSPGVVTYFDTLEAVRNSFGAEADPLQ